MICNKCEKDAGGEFYPNDRTCKECRKVRVRANRKEKINYYREYDKKRFQNDPRVRARHKRYQATDAGKESIRKSGKKWQESNPIKRGANIMVGNAVRDGRLTKLDLCEECSKTDCKINGHHNDYAKPLEVIWLCTQCHENWHKENGEGLNG